MRFLCDAMLGDSSLAPGCRIRQPLAEGGWRDRELVDLSAGEDRVLLTKDRQLALIAREAVADPAPAGRSVDENARELSEVLGVDCSTPLYSVPCR